MEYTDGAPNRPLAGEEDYAAAVLPYVKLWQRNTPSEPPALTLEQRRTQAITSLAVKTHDAIVGGFDYGIDGVVYHFSYDEEDQGNFAKANSAALLALITEDSGYCQVWRGWIGEEPHVLELTVTQYLALSRAGADHQLWWQQRYWEKEAAVKAASSFEELDHIIL